MKKATKGNQAKVPLSFLLNGYIWIGIAVVLTQKESIEATKEITIAKNIFKKLGATGFNDFFNQGGVLLTYVKLYGPNANRYYALPYHVTKDNNIEGQLSFAAIQYHNGVKQSQITFTISTFNSKKIKDVTDFNNALTNNNYMSIRYVLIPGSELVTARARRGSKNISYEEAKALYNLED